MLGSAKEVSVSSAPDRPAYSFTPFVLDVAGVAVLLAIMAGLFYVHRVQQYEQELGRSSTALLAQATVVVRNELDSVAADGLLVASDAAAGGAGTKFIQLMQLRPNYRHIALIDRNGRTLTRVVRQGAQLFELGEEQLRSVPVVPPEQRGLAAGPGGLYASAPKMESDDKSGTNRRLTITFSVPLFGQYLVRDGAIVIGYDLDGLLARVRAMTLAPRGRFDLVDETGRPIDALQDKHVRSNVHSWTTTIPVTSSGAPHEGKLRLQYDLGENVVAADKRIQALWAFALWLIALGPVTALFVLARGARASDRAAKLALAQNEQRLLEAERLARIGYWRWEARDSVLVLSPQAAAMLGCPPGERCINIQDATALHALEDEVNFVERIRQVMDTGETSAADVRVATLRGDRWVHSIIRPARDRAGAVIGVFGTLQDISARRKMEDELRTLKTDYAALLDHLPAGVMYMDVDGRLTMVSQGFLNLTGVDRQEYEGRYYLEAIKHKEAQRLLDENLEIMRTEIPKFGLVQCAKVHDETRWFRIDKVPRRDAHGKVIGVVIFLVDITALKKAEEQLRLLTSERDIMLNRIPASVIYKSTDGRIIRANRVAAGVAGMSAEEMEGRTFDDIFALGDYELARRVDEEVLRTAQPKLGLLVEGRLNDGSTRSFEIDAFPNFDEAGHVNGIVIFGVDVTQRKHAEEQIAYLAMHDPLTDLCNRRLLSDRLTQALAQCNRRQRHCALLFLDLDRFKQVNDLHGHEIGDLLLVQAAQRLRSCVRAEDTVCRTGGDEFVVLLSDTSGIADALVVADKIRTMLSQPFALRGVGATVGCSIGIASFPEHGRNEQELMSAADTAMYAAKESGRNAVFASTVGSVPPRHDAA